MNLMKLSYPRELIDLGFIIPKGAEGDAVLGKLKSRLKEVQGKDSNMGGKFNHVTILRQDGDAPTSQDEKGWQNENVLY
jgi:mannan polymerase complexes MNN9 subunit